MGNMPAGQRHAQLQESAAAVGAGTAGAKPTKLFPLLPAAMVTVPLTASVAVAWKVKGAGDMGGATAGC